MKTLRERVALVTGAASGIGLALAQRFGQEGMKVVLADIEVAALSEATAGLERSGVQALAVRTDVRLADDVSRLAECALERFGAVHVVCNNAGIITAGVSWEAPLEDYEWTLGVNVMGVVHGIRTFVPILLEQEEAHIVNTASMAALTAMPFSGIYHMSKHAVLGLSESLYHELRLRDSNVGVSALCPELIATRIDRAERNRPEELEPKDPVESAERDLVFQVLEKGVVTGVAPAEIAGRVVDAIRGERFYILSEDGWRRACETRLEDIRLGRNPTFSAAEIT